MTTSTTGLQDNSKMAKLRQQVSSLDAKTRKFSKTHPLAFALIGTSVSWTLGFFLKKLMKQKPQNDPRVESKLKPKLKVAALTSFFTLLVLPLTSGVAQAAGTSEGDMASIASHGYLGLLAGGNAPSNSDRDATPAVGLTLGAKPTPNFGVGLLATYRNQTDSGSFLGLSTGTSEKTYVFTGQASYFASGFHAGVEMGTEVRSVSGHIGDAEISDTRNSMIYGPQAGYDFAFAKAVSIGAEAHYLLMGDSDQGPHNLQAFVALKFWQ